MSPSPNASEGVPLPDDMAALKALLLAERTAAARLAGHNEQLRAIIKELQRALFGRRSEKAADPDQLQLALEDLEQALAQSEAAAEQADATLKASRTRQRRVNRGALPKHLPRYCFAVCLREFIRTKNWTQFLLSIVSVRSRGLFSFPR